jgi:hypothetical protein
MLYSWIRKHQGMSGLLFLLILIFNESIIGLIR